MDHFVFLFPDTNHIDNSPQIKFFENYYPANYARYCDVLNQCIDLRYRKNNFAITYVLLKDESLSKILRVYSSDNLIQLNASMKDMQAKVSENNSDYYVDSNTILSKLTSKPIDKLVVGGFIVTDCVDKFAQDAYNLGLDILVDEDITDMLSSAMNLPNFKAGDFPNYNPMRLGPEVCELFLQERKNKPWLWQFYF